MITLRKQKTKETTQHDISKLDAAVGELSEQIEMHFGSSEQQKPTLPRQHFKPMKSGKSFDIIYNPMQTTRVNATLKSTPHTIQVATAPFVSTSQKLLPETTDEDQEDDNKVTLKPFAPSPHTQPEILDETVDNQDQPEQDDIESDELQPPKARSTDGPFEGSLARDSETSRFSLADLQSKVPIFDTEEYHNTLNETKKSKDHDALKWFLLTLLMLVGAGVVGFVLR